MSRQVGDRFAASYALSAGHAASCAVGITAAAASIIQGKRGRGSERGTDTIAWGRRRCTSLFVRLRSLRLSGRHFSQRPNKFRVRDYCKLSRTIWRCWLNARMREPPPDSAAAKAARGPGKSCAQSIALPSAKTARRLFAPLLRFCRVWRRKTAHQRAGPRTTSCA